jgi:hypothetical protein
MTDHLEALRRHRSGTLITGDSLAHAVGLVFVPQLVRHNACQWREGAPIRALALAGALLRLFGAHQGAAGGADA